MSLTIFLHNSRRSNERNTTQTECVNSQFKSNIFVGSRFENSWAINLLRNGRGVKAVVLVILWLLLLQSYFIYNTLSSEIEYINNTLSSEIKYIYI